ncbi:MAG: hypothetical protein E5Y63_30195 [Mesorhizobium sp.]|nr:MAG: hypothetical protein EOR04_18155 [Mesorhizobium sp.]RWP65394.1 MAG: hypothetical protein EOR08_06410 [Mesorhizobium sp.]TIM26270.1 MAG: hypothetical protein E5Y63_30195 [Mesorhizobium sp.]
MVVASPRSGWQLSQTFEIGRNVFPFVIPGRSKERSDAAQTLGSMPLRESAAAWRAPSTAFLISPQYPGRGRGSGMPISGVSA